MIPLSKPTVALSAIEYVTRAMKHGDISIGGFIPKLEEGFAKYLGFDHALTCSSGTMALFLALRALGVEDGEVIMPTLTFAATADAVLMAGAKPIFCDIDIETWSLIPHEVEQKITAKTRAIISVDLYGKVSHIAPLRRFNLPIIRDAAESLGADPQHFKGLEEADVTTFSFFGNKIMTTGEGGMCVTNSPARALTIKKLRNHGRIQGYWHDLRGTNGRMPNILAALGLSQLEYLEANIAKRRRIFQWYGLETDSRQAPWLPYIFVKDNSILVDALNKNGIGARAGFTPLHKMPAYEQEQYTPNSNALGENVVLLPCYPELQRRAVDLIRKELKI